MATLLELWSPTALRPSSWPEPLFPSCFVGTWSAIRGQASPGGVPGSVGKALADHPGEIPKLGGTVAAPPGRRERLMFRSCRRSHTFFFFFAEAWGDCQGWHDITGGRLAAPNAEAGLTQALGLLLSGERQPPRCRLKPCKSRFGGDCACPSHLFPGAVARHPASEERRASDRPCIMVRNM